MIESHHERWDGSGYPHGLSGEDIPLAGRLMSLADAYDAMVSRRVYKQEYPHTYALDYIRQNSGKHFDPDVVAAFIAKNEVFLRIAQEYSADSESDHGADSGDGADPDPHPCI
jgi:putative two-component system response regulator